MTRLDLPTAAAKKLCDEVSISTAAGALMQHLMRMNKCHCEFKLDSPWGELKLEVKLTVDGEEAAFK